MFSKMSKRKQESKKSGRVKRIPRGPSSWLMPSAENKVTSLMLQGESVLASAAGGTAYTSIPFDPSTAGYSFGEWANVAALWTEVKHVMTQVQFIRANGDSITQGSPLYIGWRFDTSVAPTSVAQVSQLASCKFWDIQNDTSPRGFTITAKARGPLNWSPTSTVVVNSYAGCPGSIQAAGTGFAASINLAVLRVRSIYMFRGRA